MRIHELGHVVLYVSHLTRSADFYKNILGFTEIHRDLHTAFFSSGRTHHELLLIEVGGSPKEGRAPTPGLYHIGFKIGESDDDLRKAKEELLASGVPLLGQADHHVTHSLYILDPDNNELELYIDVDDSWKENKEKLLQPTRGLDL